MNLELDLLTFPQPGITGAVAHMFESAGSAHAAALPNDVIDRFAVAGPSEHCIARLSELIEAGAERLVLVPGSRDANRDELVASMARLAAEVLPGLR